MKSCCVYWTALVIPLVAVALAAGAPTVPGGGITIQPSVPPLPLYNSADTS